MKKIFYAFTAAIILTACVCPVRASDVSFLKTPNFLIKHNRNLTAYASVVAERAESHYKNIEFFLRYSLNNYINISISENGGVSHFPAYDSINLSAASNFNDIDDDLYRSVFMLFIEAILNESSVLYPFIYDDEHLYNMLCCYSITGFDVKNELILHDYFLLKKNRRISIKELNSLNEETGRAAYAGFFSFLESEYGRNVMLRVLKDSGYYKSFINSLISVTGKTPEEIDSGFNNFLIKKFSGFLTSQTDERFQIIPFAGAVTDFFVSKDKLTLLVDEDGNRSVELFDLVKNEVYLKKELQKDCLIARIFPIENNRLGVAGNSANGGRLYIHDEESLFLNNAFELPGVYINNVINYSLDNSFIVNSVAGTSSVIIEADYNKGFFNRISAPNLYKNSDIIPIGASLFYIGKKDLYEFIELSISGGEIKTWLKLSDEIVSLSVSGDIILLTANNSSGGYVLQFDFKTGNFSKIFSCSSFLYKTCVSDNRIYMLTYYNGTRSIIVENIPH